MASVLKIVERWRAQIRKQGRSISKTFRTKAAAQAWAREAELGLETPATAAAGRSPTGLPTTATCAKSQAGRWYLSRM